jgi:hypothetical protein
VMQNKPTGLLVTAPAVREAAHRRAMRGRGILSWPRATVARDRLCDAPGERAGLGRGGWRVPPLTATRCSSALPLGCGARAGAPEGPSAFVDTTAVVGPPDRCPTRRPVENPLRSSFVAGEVK